MNLSCLLEIKKPKIKTKNDENEDLWKLVFVKDGTFNDKKIQASKEIQELFSKIFIE